MQDLLIDIFCIMGILAVLAAVETYWESRESFGK